MQDIEIKKFIIRPGVTHIPGTDAVKHYADLVGVDKSGNEYVIAHKDNYGALQHLEIIQTHIKTKVSETEAESLSQDNKTENEQQQKE